MDRTPFTPQMLQGWLGVSEDGTWGRDTEAAARAKLGNPVDSTNRPWGTKRIIIGVQQAMLKEKGFLVTVDGLMGPETLDAMERWVDSLKAQDVPKVTASSLSYWEQFKTWWLKEDEDNPIKAPPAERDVSTRLQKQNWPHQRDVDTFFGPKGMNQVRIVLPYQMKIAWEPKTKVNSIVCHKLVAPSIVRCLTAVKEHYSEEAIKRLGLDLYGGCLNVRKVRGGNTWSMHSWGIALDFDPDRNQFRWKGDKARLAKEDARAFWEIWEAEGWVSLGRLADYDWMHVQAARIR